ncbi:asparagine synthetase B [Nonlabens sp. MB-3u-79]|jgi:hypothetical protein|uniref:DUF2911 domain-containing protein n=1 Tax=Nonlabens sp. MB-3u-79 TaxID=2058134 RepID=UPI000C308FE1|nr:DUF2911 domain-containing protein [Nonlabens sp. MB-3u-79]AUC78139.1 asparagine synthetase B [Nonlabens sp. MB-3u-79]|tara:strand:- start:19850 stop:20398 length:549 start_codon:yes stop_codon:yes gene_type:complete
MKKQLLFLFFLCSSFLLFSQNDDSLTFSKLDKSPLDVVMYRDTNKAAVARVIYSRPSKQDREIFGKLVPFNAVWRTGANEATEIAFYQDVKINNKLVKAGSYSLYTIPGEEEWKFILNTATTQSGLEYDPSKNLLTATMDLLPSPQKIESFSISFVEQQNGGLLFLGWDDTIASIAFTMVTP